MKEPDALTVLVGATVVQKILHYLHPYIRSFAMLTCSSWNHTIRKFETPVFLSIKTQGNFVARCGYIECLKFLVKNGFRKVSRDACAYAADGGSLECLRYLHENGCEWLQNTCESAATGGHLECLKYAHENGCAWDAKTCEVAAKAGKLDCLQYAHENGCKWDDRTTELAALHGKYECLKYAMENNCLLVKYNCIHAMHLSHQDCSGDYQYDEWHWTDAPCLPGKDHLSCKQLLISNN